MCLSKRIRAWSKHYPPLAGLAVVLPEVQGTPQVSEIMAKAVIGLDLTLDAACAPVYLTSAAIPFGTVAAAASTFLPRQCVGGHRSESYPGGCWCTCPWRQSHLALLQRRRSLPCRGSAWAYKGRAGMPWHDMYTCRPGSFAMRRTDLWPHDAQRACLQGCTDSLAGHPC